MLVGNLQNIDRAETLGYSGVSRHGGLSLDLAAGDVAVVVVEIDGVGFITSKATGAARNS
ncbi:hypothetical protein A7P89_10890 [Eikenella corrodens]|uniref:Uncharacterized protein n=1 Tax=Eikenella corrodens TaxID=539 RepID=A0A1A9RL09_EIKCO|nr:hypothetical protein A7P89_10890 [Eikenella corrodens]